MGSINSFTNRFFIYGFESHILNPSKCELRRVNQTRQTLKNTIHNWGENPLAFVELKKSHVITSLLSKSVRVVAKILYFLAVTLLISLAGVLYHGLKSLHHIKNYCLEKEGSEKEWHQAEAHTKAMLKDLFFSLSNVVAWPYLITSIQGGSYIYAIGVTVMNPAALWQGFGGDFSQICYISEREARACQISRLFRDELGVVGPKGKLLPYHEEDFESHEEPGILAEMHKTACEDLLKVIKRYNWKIPNDNLRISMNDHFPPDGFQIAQILDQYNFRDIQPLDSIKDIVADFKIKQARLDKIFNMREKFYIWNNIPDELPKFLVTKESSAHFFNKN